MIAWLAVITALHALLFLGLSANVNRLRWRYRTPLGTQGQDTLRRAVRAHANFAEFVPFALLLIWLDSGFEADVIPVLLAVLLLASRLAHAYGLIVCEPKDHSFAPRMMGIAGTYATILGAAAMLVVHAAVKMAHL